jgi:MFS family permease
MSLADDNHPSMRKAWFVSFLAGLFFLFEFIQLSSFDVLNPFVQHNFRLNSSQVGVLGSAFLWGNVAFLLPAGLLLDKYGARRCILSSLLISIFGAYLFGFSTTYTLAFMGRFLTGIGNAFCFVSLVVLVSQWFSSNKRAFAMGVLVNLAFIGGMLAHTPLVWLLGHFGWKIVMLSNVIFGVLVLLLIWSFVSDSPNSTSSTTTNNPSSLSFKQLLFNIVNLQNFGAGFYTSCLNLPIMVLCALWGMQYLQVVHHLSALQASNVVSMIFFGSMLGSPLSGYLSDQMKKRKPLMWVGGICSLLLCLPLCLSEIHLSTTTLMAIFFLLGCFTSTQVLSYPLIAESNSIQFAGRACSFASMIIMGGGMLAQLLFGALLNIHVISGTEPNSSAFAFAMLLFPISILLSLFVLLGMKETYCRNHLES